MLESRGNSSILLHGPARRMTEDALEKRFAGVSEGLTNLQEKRQFWQSAMALPVAS